MSLKSEVAAIMASEGDHEKKISLLKKAVVSVTRQKQELEIQCAQLQGDLQRSTEELAGAKEENLKLHRRVAALETELDQERRKGSHFGQNIMKGLSSLVAGSDTAGGAGAAVSAGGTGGAARAPRAPAPAGTGDRERGSSAMLGLKPEDVESLVRENEKLLRQVYSLQTQSDEVGAKAKAGRDRAKAELERSQKEVADLRGLLQAATRACDDLNATCTSQRALIAFCRHFFRLEAHHDAGMGAEERGITFAIGSASSDRSTPVLTDGAMASTEVQDTCAHLCSVLDAVLVLLITLKDTLPCAQRATMGDLRLFADRIVTLLEAHQMEKISLTYQVGELQRMLAEGAAEAARDDAAGDAPASLSSPSASQQALFAAQRELVAGLMKWLELMRSQAAMLVDCCVGQLPPGGPYRPLAQADSPSAVAAAVGIASGLPERAQSSSAPVLETREAFVREVTDQLSTFLSSITGSLGALQMLLEASMSPTVRALLPGAGAAPPAGVWMEALLRFWWEGSSAAPALARAATALSQSIASVADACVVDAARSALVHLSERIAVFGSRAGGPRERAWTDSVAGEECGGLVSLLRLPSEAAGHRCHTTSSPTAGRGRERVAAVAAALSGSAQDELTHALAAADRAAVFYWTQMNATVLELAEREDQLLDTREELRAVRGQLAECREEASQAQRAFQGKIAALSDQLVQYAARSAGSAAAAAGRR